LERLNASEIARITHFHPSALKRYLGVEAVRQFMGVADNPPTYPLESLPMFRQLKDLHDAGKISPSRFDALKDILFASSSVLGRSSDSDHAASSPLTGQQISSQIGLRTLVPSAQVPSLPATPAEFQEMLTQSVLSALRQHHAETAPAAILSVQQAAVLLSCSPGSVSRHVRPIPGKRGKYSAAAVQAKIREWCDSAS
jgi:hypothetical protein